MITQILADSIAPKIKNPFATENYQRALKKKNSLTNDYSNKSSF